MQHAFSSHEIDDWLLSLPEREQHESARDNASTDADLGRATPGGAVVMDHMLRNGMWAPVETRIFHRIILVSAVVFVLERFCSAFVCIYDTYHDQFVFLSNFFFAEDDRVSNRASRR